jgi:hypothetical protein
MERKNPTIDVIGCVVAAGWIRKTQVVSVPEQFLLAPFLCCLNRASAFEQRELTFLFHIPGVDGDIPPMSPGHG